MVWKSIKSNLHSVLGLPAIRLLSLSATKFSFVETQVLEIVVVKAQLENFPCQGVPEWVRTSFFPKARYCYSVV